MKFVSTCNCNYVLNSQAHLSQSVYTNVLVTSLNELREHLHPSSLASGESLTIGAHVQRGLLTLGAHAQ